MKRYLQCAEQHVSLSKLTKYCACHEKWISWLILVTHETLFTMRGGTSVIVQTHQILRLPRKMNLMIDPCHTWNAIYNARSNTCHCPNSPNTAPATKNESHDWSLSHMKRYLQCAEEQVSLSKLTKYCACHEKWISWLILVTHERLFTMRGATSVIVQTHQILRLPRKMNLMIDPCHTWNAIYNARSNKCHCPNSPNTAPATQNDSPKFCKNFWKTAETIISNAGPIREWSEQDPRMIRAGSENETVTPQPASQARLLFTPTTSILYWKMQHFALRLSFQISPNTAPATKSDSSTSPNTAPATKNESHDWSLSHMKRYLQCAEQQVSLSKLTKYCACHAKWFSKISKKFVQNRWNVSSNAGPIRTGSDHKTVSPQPASQPRLLFTPTTSILYWKIQRFALRLSFQISPNTAPATKSDTSTSPNTAPATQNDSHDQSATHMKRYLQCAQQQVSLSKLTKYCACHEKRISFLMIDPCHTWNAIYIARRHKCHCPNSPNTAPATQNDSPTFQRNFSKTAETSFPMRGRSETIPRMIRPWNRHPQPASQPRLLFTTTTTFLYWKIQHFALRLSF